MKDLLPLIDKSHSYSNGHNGSTDHNGSNGNHELDLLAPEVEEVDYDRGDENKAAFYDPAFEALIEQMLIRLGEDPAREGLQRTPFRVAKSMDFLTNGYQLSLEEVINGALFASASEEMVIVKGIEFYSLCEHHLLPFFGKIHIAYIPNGKIIGLSKLARVVDIFARRLQVQEQLTNQIADALVEVLNPGGVAVMSEASHLCMMMRGVQKQNSTTITSAMRGLFKDDRNLRKEFISLV
jgi:GTP cyclohydrolase I